MRTPDIIKPDMTTVSFRIEKHYLQKFHAKFKPTVGIHSVNQFVRKVVIDIAENRLIYLNPKDKGNNPLLGQH